MEALYEMEECQWAPNVYNHFCESMDQKILMSNMEQAGSHLDDARND